MKHTGRKRSTWSKPCPIPTFSTKYSA